ncbi:3,4-dihydroxy-2-butanone-4-phosphate synthase [Pseudoxanthomonas spadix]|nr:3,4-dihydroxy-2-butanone-4-phosphate synthase [Pseudoxanthomonas spadix]
MPCLDLPECERVPPTTLDRVKDAIAAIARGEMVIVVDDADRENEG